jgi:hypothetical protein
MHVRPLRSGPVVPSLSRRTGCPGYFHRMGLEGTGSTDVNDGQGSTHPMTRHCAVRYMGDSDIDPTPCECLSARRSHFVSAFVRKDVSK